MKHVFFVHRPFTIEIIKSLCQSKNIAIDDCLIITKQWYLNFFDKKILHPFKYELYEEFRFSNFKQYRNKAKDQIEKIIGKNTPYIFYTAHDKFQSSNALQYHPNCKGFYYLEEGLASYNSIFLSSIENKHSFVRFLKHLPYLENQWFKKYYKTKTDYLFHDSFNLLGTINLTSHAFKFINKEHIKIEIEALKWKFKSKVVFVFDDLVGAQLVKEEEYFRALKLILTKLHDKDICIKFHPIQKDTEKQYIINLFEEKNIVIEIIPTEITLEHYFEKNSLTLYGFFSSLLYYNRALSDNRNNSYSFINLLLGSTTKLKSEAYTTSIKFLKNNNVEFIN